MFCKKCGTEINDNQKFCPKCGEEKENITLKTNDKRQLVNNKKIIVTTVAVMIVFIAALIICLIVSSKNDNNFDDGTTLNQITVTKANENTTINESTKEYKYISYNDFSEDIAWINFEDDSNSYWGCIDKTGKLLFSFENIGINEVTNFSSGYAYIIYNDCIKIVNKSGEITGIYITDGNNTVLAYGDGNIFIREHIADYNSSVYNYSIIDNKGEVIQTFSLDDLKDYYGFKYFGKGIFGYYTEPFKYKIYFPESEKWIDLDGNSESFYFYNDTAFLGIHYGGGKDSSDGYRGKIYLINTKGEEKSLIIPDDYGWNWKINPIIENKSILHSYSYYYDYLIAFNVNDFSFRKMPEEMQSKIDYKHLPILSFKENRIALPWNGSDNKKYIAVFNENLELIKEPILIDDFENYTYSESRLIIKNDSLTIVFDENCNELFDSNKVGYTQLSKYQNGVSRIENELIPTYIDKDGKKIFDSIDTSVLEKKF